MQEVDSFLECVVLFYRPFFVIEIETLRKNAWTKGLKKAGMDDRPIIQTRHTFATMMVSSGENLGWIQKMMGHSSLNLKQFPHIAELERGYSE